MADKSTNILTPNQSFIGSEGSRVVPTEVDPEHHFEHAYYTNSYPQECSKAKSTISCLKVIIFIAILVEVSTLIGLGVSFSKFQSIVTKADSVIQFGAFATLMSSAAKILSAFNAYNYSSDRLGRTPEKREQTAKFFRAVTFFTGLITYFMIHMLNKHAMSTVEMLRTTYSENDLQGSSDFLNRLTDSIAGVQLNIFTTFALHLLIHFMTHRLDKAERSAPRVVDLTAFNSYPSKDQ